MTAGHPDHDWVLNTPLTFDLNDVGKNPKDMTEITLTNRLLHFSDVHQKFEKACLKRLFSANLSVKLLNNLFGKTSKLLTCHLKNLFAKIEQELYQAEAAISRYFFSKIFNQSYNHSMRCVSALLVKSVILYYYFLLSYHFT